MSAARSGKDSPPGPSISHASPAAGCRIDVRSEETRLVIAVDGELDLGVADRIEEEIAKAERGGAEAIVLDLSKLTFIDSTGIAVLIAAARRSAEDTNRLRIRRSHAPGVRRMLALTGVDGRLPFVD